MSDADNCGKNPKENQPDPVSSTSSYNNYTDRDFMEAEKESRNTTVECAEVLDVTNKNSELDQTLKDLEEALSKTLGVIETELTEYSDECKAKVAGLAGHSSQSEDEDDDDDDDDDDDFKVMEVMHPYFRFENEATPSDNIDTLAMKAFNKLDYSQVTVSDWTERDKSRLLSVLLDISKSDIKEKLFTQLKNLQKTERKTRAVIKNINHIEKELKSLKKMTLDNFNLLDNYEFDWDDVSMKLHRSPQECKSIWDLLLHPKINKASWSRQEHNKLKNIAAQMNFQNWDAIAKELNNNRTGYQCFVYFRTNVNLIATDHSWTQEELNSLKDVVQKMGYTDEGLIPWDRIAAAMHNRTEKQCYNKYMRLVAKRMGGFSTEEDAIILNFVDEYGPDFKKMTSHLAGRSANQLRSRHNLLKKLQVADWTEEDDQKLIQIMASQKSKANFSTAIKHFPRKDRQQIHSRSTFFFFRPHFH